MEIVRHGISNPDCCSFLHSKQRCVAQIQFQRSAPGCPRVFSEVFNIVTDRNERLEFIELRKDHWTDLPTYRNPILDANFGGQ